MKILSTWRTDKGHGAARVTFGWWLWKREEVVLCKFAKGSVLDLSLSGWVTEGGRGVSLRNGLALQDYIAAMELKTSHADELNEHRG